MTARSSSPEPAPPPRKPGWAARLDDRFHRFRERRARKRGYTAIVVPYTGYGGPGWVRVLGRVLLAKPSKDEGTRETIRKIRGWKSFTSIPVGNADVLVDIAGVTHTVQADRGGVIDVDLEATFEPGWHTISLSVEGSEPAQADVNVLDPVSGIGIVSDIDDTVMVTYLPRPLLAAWNSFVLDVHARIPVPGMAVLLERLTHTHVDSGVIYLSTGAWNVAPTLGRFLQRHLYPPGPLLLTDWGPTHDRFFRSGRAHKIESLERLRAEFPELRWILIGDDGQHDEDIYGGFVERHPDAVAAVAIRQLTGGEAVLAGGRSKAHHDDTGTPWVYAPDGAGLAEQLADLGLLDP